MKYLIVNCFLLFLNSFLYGQDSTIFNPNIQKYEGYVNQISWRYRNDIIGLNILSPTPIKHISIKHRNGKFYIKKKYKIVFWGSIIFNEVLPVYGNISNEDWLRSLPSFPENNDRILRALFRKYYINTIYTKFSAFEYGEYKVFETHNKFPKLPFWGIYGKTIYPDMIKSNNKYLIVTKFIK